MQSLHEAIVMWHTSIQTLPCQRLVIVNLDIHLPPVSPHVQSNVLSLPQKGLVLGSIRLKHRSLSGNNKSRHSLSSSPESNAENLPSLSSHYLLAIWHAHAIRMCVSIEVLLLLEIAAKALALGYRTIFVLKK